MADMTVPPLFPKRDATAQRPAVQATAKRRAITTPRQPFTDAPLAETQARPALRKNDSASMELFPKHATSRSGQTAPQPVAREPATGPATLNLPAIPRSVQTAQMPAVIPPGSQRGLQKLTRDHERALDAYATTLIPGTLRADEMWRGVPKLRHRARERSHRVVLVSAVALALLTVLAFAPLVQANAPVGSWIANAGVFKLPTPTATAPPSVTHPYYPSHPYVAGVGSFICTALPFARLAQRNQLNDGMQHPWYVSVILAQWGVEQGWRMPSYTGYNFGNVSAIAGFPTIGGLNVPGSPGAFAYAYTPLQGVDEYVIFTHNYHFYYNVMASYPNGPRAQAVALGLSPWDADHYAINGYAGAKLVNVINSFNLYRFDNPNTGC